MVHCGSAFEPGVSGLPYYWTPRLCIPDVIGALAVWRHNDQKKEVPFNESIQVRAERHPITAQRAGHLYASTKSKEG